MSGLDLIATLETECADLRAAIAEIIEARDAEDLEALLAAMDKAEQVAARSALRASST